MKHPDTEIQAPIDELRVKVESVVQYGTSDPDSDTPGKRYYKYDADDSTAALTPFIKIGNTWYGG
ncbi:MAG: hypothetical protein ACYTEQ_01105 [Planctomycetota bacterium]